MLYFINDNFVGKCQQGAGPYWRELYLADCAKMADFNLAVFAFWYIANK